jgi:hypothetical protein
MQDVIMNVENVDVVVVDEEGRWRGKRMSSGKGRLEVKEGCRTQVF